MKATFAALALVGSALANPMPQAVTSAVAPDAPKPSGCSESTSGQFQITVVNVTSTSSKKRDDESIQGNVLELALSGGILKDGQQRTGYIASNYQFQFDSPPQAGAIYTAGFSLCSNNSLALGGSSIWYQCYTGGFYNLYDRNWAEHCNAIYLVAQKGGSDSPATQISDGQPGATPAPSYPLVTQISDGQPQGPTGGLPVTQITDGQPQAPTGAPSAPAVTQISDGQPQAPTGAPSAPAVTQISDGQPQAPTGAPSVPVVTQISDGQPQAPTGAPSGPVVTQISDGQPQAPTAAPVPSGPVVTQISDGQPQAPTAAPPAPPVTQISDGQPQAPVATGNFTLTSPTAPPQFTGAAATPIYALGVMAAGLMGGVVALL